MGGRLGMRSHPFAFLVAAVLVAIAAYAAYRLSAGDTTHPEAAARAWVEATFPARRDLAVRRGHLFLEYFEVAKPPPEELPLPDFLERLGTLALDEVAIASVRSEGSMASVRVLLVTSDGGTGVVELELSRVDGRWGVVDPPRFVWEIELERRLAAFEEAERAFGRRTFP